MASSKTTSDGYQWTKSKGMQQGLPTISVISPATNLNGSSSQGFDVIVIGAGYAGLTAARDLTLAGHSVLLLEARDRVGGRTWSTDLPDGAHFDMGGTYFHWGQPHIYREISRYGMQREIECTVDESTGVNCFTLVTPEERRNMSHEEENALFESGMTKFINVDGSQVRSVLPFPHDPHRNPAALSYDTMTLADRFAQLGDSLTPSERAAVAALVLVISGSTLDKAGFFDMLRQWALGFYSVQGFLECGLAYKFGAGQSTLARRMFDECVGTGRLSYAFGAPASAVRDDGGGAAGGVAVTVEGAAPATYRAARVVCAVPQNVLSGIAFWPPLPAAKAEAARIGHVNKSVKLHAEVAGTTLRSWAGVTYPDNGLLYGVGGGLSPDGRDTELVFFGAEATELQPEEDGEKTLEAVQAFFDEPVDVKRLLFHNWNKDPFSNGAWSWFPPNMAAKYLDALRERHGNVLFASADWALGWRGALDGAFEEGARVAYEMTQELRTKEKN
ncbi:monoamine oxidase N [Lineolata rhizophorae]|uniref:monoamine oxidase n=1 Tax=Lineolata rhizophorae TaxID=578093 RepID=A0A6A6NLT1_9PEZI|nr:monoamine oxidase N [Lineolata rhizophorae]